MTETTPGPSDSAPETEAAATEDDKAKRLSEAQWAEICTHWECGTKNGRELTEEYGISGTSLHKHFKRYGIVRNSKVHLVKRAAEVKVLGAVTAAEDPLAVSYEQKRKGRIAQTREISYGLFRFEESRLTKIAKQIQDGTRKEAECANDIKALRQFGKAVLENEEARLRMLKADADVDESQLPVLVFRDLSQEDILAMTKTDDDDDFSLDLPEGPSELSEDDEVVEEGEP